MRWLIMLILGLSQSVWADEDKIRQSILGINPAIQILAIAPVANTDLFEVSLGSGERIYITGDGSHFIAGDLYQVGAGGVRNLTDIGRQADRLAMLETLDPSTLVVFSPKGPVKHRLLVFTDIDCGYCRRLHQEVETLLEGGVEVQYAAFPRAGIGSESYQKYVSVVCAKDPQAAMTEAKLGVDPDPATCENAVADQFRLGQQLGISGTPTLIFENGEMQPGYSPAAELVSRMNQQGS